MRIMSEAMLCKSSICASQAAQLTGVNATGTQCDAHTGEPAPALHIRAAAGSEDVLWARRRRPGSATGVLLHVHDWACATLPPYLTLCPPPLDARLYAAGAHAFAQLRSCACVHDCCNSSGTNGHCVQCLQPLKDRLLGRLAAEVAWVDKVELGLCTFLAG
jgi:hypothetical protein